MSTSSDTLVTVLDGPFRGTEAIAAGLLTPGLLRGPGYHRVFPDVYVPASLEPDLAVRSQAAYLWGRRYAGVLAGYSAAELLTAPRAPADAPAEIVLSRSHRYAPVGLVIRQDELADDEWRTSQHIDLTTPVRTAYDLARRGTLVEAVVALDAIAGRFGFAPAEILLTAERHPRARGTRRLPEVVSLAEPLAESPMESRLRLVLVLGGLPRPASQHRVRDGYGRVTATVDLAYPEELIAIEYEGEDHFTAERGPRDVYQSPERILTEINRALRG